MIITENMIHKAASVLHLHYGVRAKPSKGDLDLTRHMLMTAVYGVEFQNQRDVDAAYDAQRNAEGW